MIHSYVASYFPEAHIAVFLNCKSDFIIANETLVGLQFGKLEIVLFSPIFICQKPVYTLYYVYILPILDDFAKLSSAIISSLSYGNRCCNHQISLFPL